MKTKLILEQVRKYRKMKQTELSRKSGVNRTTIVRMEKEPYADVQLSTLVKLAEVLRCDFYDLVETEDDNEHLYRESENGYLEAEAQ